jgi:hypothetical protein
MKPDNTIWLMDWEGAQNDCVDGTEYRRIQTDPEPQCGEYQNGHSCAPADEPQREV